MYKIKYILLLYSLVVTCVSNGQGMWDDIYNRFGAQAGVHQFSIITDDIDLEKGISWSAGFTARAFLYENFQVVYGLSFYDFKNTVAGRERQDLLSRKDDIQYNLVGLQTIFLGSYKIIDHYLSVEAGPVVQMNGRFKPRQDKELYFIEGYNNIVAKDLKKISGFNVNLALGVTGGFQAFKFWAQYQHGINNILRGLKDEGLETKDPKAINFKGHIKIFSLGIAIFL